MRKKSLSLVTGLFFAIASHGLATPKNVILIRHAEKIPKENHLDLKGYERAEALPYYFSYNPLYNNPPITHVFATGLEDADSSVRPIQTCTPTANYLKLPLNIDFKHTQTKEIANELLTNPKYDNSTVLICWTHGHVGYIVMALGCEDPGPWPADVFDQVYRVTFDAGQKPKFQKILQKLMFGDRITFESKQPPLPPSSKMPVDEDE